MEEDKPLLFFLTPKRAEREKKSLFADSKIKFPSKDRQKERIEEMFSKVEKAFIVSSPDFETIEKVLVLETIGRVDDFYKVAREIEGLEWLAERDEEELKADEDFYKKIEISLHFFKDNLPEEFISPTESREIQETFKKQGFIDKNNFLNNDKDLKTLELENFPKLKDKIINCIERKKKEDPLKGRLYLVMSNQQALEELRREFEKWKNDSKITQGLGKLKDIFKQLKEIRFWNVEDRIRDTGIVEEWKEYIEITSGSATKKIFEIELWFRENKKIEIESKVKKLIEVNNGRILKSSFIEDIGFHCLKGEMDVDNIKKFLEKNYEGIFSCDDVKIFRPTGQNGIIISSDDNVEEDSVSPNGVLPDEKLPSIVALLDGYPFSQHSLLKNYINVNDENNFLEGYQSGKFKHSTAMASLICHNDLTLNSRKSITRKIIVVPIMKPRNDKEEIPQDEFLEDLIHKAVKNLFSEEQSNIKIINLSIGDPNKLFFHSLSSTGKLLDWLSFKYNVLFCVSAGNIIRKLDPSKNAIGIMNKKKKEQRHYRLLSPSESINCLTIGALHKDSSDTSNLPDYLIDPLPNYNDLPSPISPLGFGFRNSIKPDILFSGGKTLYDNSGKLTSNQKSIGIKHATNTSSEGEINSYTHTFGTSNANALVVHHLAHLYEMLQEIQRANQKTIPEDNIAVILKALAVHKASHNERAKSLIQQLADGKRDKKREIIKFLSYGEPNFDEVMLCTKKRATLIGFSKLKKDMKDVFSFPYPDNLNNMNKKLTITLAYFSPINIKNRKYRVANLTFKNDFLKRTAYDWQQVKNGTLQHEIFEGRNNIDEKIKIEVECREDGGVLEEEIPYALIASLEIREDIEIYTKIKERLKVIDPIKL